MPVENDWADSACKCYLICLIKFSMVGSYSLIFIISLHTPSHSLILSTSASLPLDSLQYAHRVNTGRCFPQIDDWLIAKADTVRGICSTNAFLRKCSNASMLSSPPHMGSAFTMELEFCSTFRLGSDRMLHSYHLSSKVK